MPRFYDDEVPFFTVYELIDDEGKYLYIGQTKDIGKRLYDHNRNDWFDQVAQIKLTRYPGRQQAQMVEKIKIGEHRPEHNCYAGKWG